MALLFGFSDPVLGVHAVAVERGAAAVLREPGELRTLDAPALAKAEGIDGPWRVHVADGFDVTLTALGDAAHFADGRTEWYCGASGMIDGAAPVHELSGTGHVVALGSSDPNVAREHSTAIWLTPSLAVASAARRPRGARGQEDDELEAFVFSGEPLTAAAVAEPLVSAAFDASGTAVRRAGVELYGGPLDDGDERPPLSMRIAGETLAVVELPLDGGLLLSAFIRWRHGGHVGAGRYDITLRDGTTQLDVPSRSQT